VGSRLFTREALNQWLERRYQRVWKCTRRDAVLWELKPTSHSELK
jgi:hypothetical protein